MSAVHGDDRGLPTVSVVMPTYNRRDSLERVLAPLLTGGDAAELVIVVDGCDDGSYELLQQLAERDGRVKPIRVPNGGAARARQVGAEAATGDVVLVLDDDVVAGPNLVRGHAELHQGREALVGVGYMPTAIPAERRPGTFATVFYAEEYERHCARWEEQPDTVLATMWMGNISLRREDALRVGLAGANIPNGYHVDRDFGIRCAAAGLTGVFDRSLHADHAHSRPLDAFRRDGRDQGASMAAVVRTYGDAAGSDRTEVGLPLPVRLALRVGHIEVLARPICAVLAVVVRVAGRLGRLDAELLAARFLRRMEFRRGEAGAARASG